MISWLLILVPLTGAALAAAWPNQRTRPWLLPAFGLMHGLLVARAFFHPPVTTPATWLGFDPLARAVLPAISLLFLVCAAYAVPYLRIRSERKNRVFVALLLAVLGLLSAGHQARHLGLLWIATEAVTLAAVPLLHFNGTPRAFEATWKYLLVGGTGIALSLLGSFCLGYASLHGGGGGDLTFSALAARGAGLSRPWVLTSWVLLLVGYGTKMGLAPMHTWKPDAYGEAPGLVGAILAGGVTTVAFTAILRVRSVVGAAGRSGHRRPHAPGRRSVLHAGGGAVPAGHAGLQTHARLLQRGAHGHSQRGRGFRGPGVAAALFHVWSNGLTKGALFLAAGNIRRAAGSASMDVVRGMGLLTPRVRRRSSSPACSPSRRCRPSDRSSANSRSCGRPWHPGTRPPRAAFLGCLLLAFFGLTRVVFGIVDGRPHPTIRASAHRFLETSGVIAPPLVLMGLSLWLGLFPPALLRDAWAAAAAQVFSHPMSASTPFALLPNAGVMPWADVPAWPVKS